MSTNTMTLTTIEFLKTLNYVNDRAVKTNIKEYMNEIQPQSHQNNHKMKEVIIL